MPQYQILFWKDIPTQIKVFEGRRPISKQLPQRFQFEIDRIAMKEGLMGSDDYLDQWHWTSRQERSGTTEEILESLAQELQQEFDARQRKRGVRSGKEKGDETT